MTSMMLSDEDREIIRRLAKHVGSLNTSAVIRFALRDTLSFYEPTGSGAPPQKKRAKKPRMPTTKRRKVARKGAKS